MRMRYKTMSQYGIDADTERAIKERCKKLSADDRKILFNCALSAAPGLEVEVYYSITHMAEREGYYNMARKDGTYRQSRTTFMLTGARLWPSFTTFCGCVGCGIRRRRRNE